MHCCTQTDINFTIGALRLNFFISRPHENRIVRKELREMLQFFREYVANPAIPCLGDINAPLNLSFLDQGNDIHLMQLANKTRSWKDITLSVQNPGVDN